MDGGKLKLKLLVDKAQHKVLFAEAGKDAVDFLFGILALPLGEVVRLLSTRQSSMVGSLGKLYHSVEIMDDTYVQADQSKTHLLTPRVASPAFAAGAALTWKKADDPTSPGTYYWCGSHGGRFSDDARAVCPSCTTRKMSQEMVYVPPLTSAEGKAETAADSCGGGVLAGGLVKGVVTYMVTDDLTVSPMSIISFITLLKKCGVKDVSSLEVMTADLNMSKAVEMLKASLQSTTVLTDVFLPKKPKRDPPCDCEL